MSSTSALNADEAKTLTIMRMVTAPISIIASVTILVLITRSTTRFSTTQNRLLVGLSVSDIISSVPMTLASLPMPRGSPNVWLALGNTTTCNLQGFFCIFGALITPSYNAALCIFFLLKVRYNVSDHTMRCKVEPFLHGFPIINALFIAIYCLFKGYINPDVDMCFIADKPLDCSISSNIACERGDGYGDDWVVRYGGSYVGFTIPSIIFSTMINLYITVRRQEQRMETRYGRGSLTLTTIDPPPTTQQRESRQQSRYLKMTMYRALAYSLAWLIPFQGVTLEVWLILLTDFPHNFALLAYNSFFHPLQGFFNFIVYIYPKVLHERQENPENSIWKIFASVLCRH